MVFVYSFLLVLILVRKKKISSVLLFCSSKLLRSFSCVSFYQVQYYPIYGFIFKNVILSPDHIYIYNQSCCKFSSIWLLAWQGSKFGTVATCTVTPRWETQPQPNVKDGDLIKLWLEWGFKFSVFSILNLFLCQWNKYLRWYYSVKPGQYIGFYYLFF